MQWSYSRGASGACRAALQPRPVNTRKAASRAQCRLFSYLRLGFLIGRPCAASGDIVEKELKSRHSRHGNTVGVDSVLTHVSRLSSTDSNCDLSRIGRQISLFQNVVFSTPANSAKIVPASVTSGETKSAPSSGHDSSMRLRHGMGDQFSPSQGKSQNNNKAPVVPRTCIEHGVELLQHRLRERHGSAGRPHGALPEVILRLIAEGSRKVYSPMSAWSSTTNAASGRATNKKKEKDHDRKRKNKDSLPAAAAPPGAYSCRASRR